MSAAVAETKWAYRLAKSAIYPTSLPAINERIAALQSLCHEPNPGIPPVQHARCSPLYLSVDVDESVAQRQLGRREAYVPLSASPSSSVSESVAASAVLAVAQTLARLHAHGVVHGHVHLGLVLRSQPCVAEGANQQGCSVDLRLPGRVVLCEAELPMSALVPQGATGAVARRCAAPEILRGELYGGAADVWGLGVLLLQLLSEPARLCVTADIADSDLLSPFIAALSPQATSFVLPCLKADPAARPLLWDVLQHPFLRQTSAGGESHVDVMSRSSSQSSEAHTRGDDDSDVESLSAEASESSDESKRIV